MAAVELSHITKSFGDLKAVDDCSFSVEKGELFGSAGSQRGGQDHRHPLHAGYLQARFRRWSISWVER